MKSNICIINNNPESLKAILNEVEKSAEYNKLDKKSNLHLRLLAEELSGMLPQLVAFSEGEFWVENNRNRYEIHAVINVATNDPDYRDKVLSIATSGHNEASKGIMGKIRCAIDVMVECYSGNEMELSYGPLEMGAYSSSFYSQAWSLNNYRNQVEESYMENGNSEDWDELEKSIVANLADDVIVGIQGGKVHVIIKKRFL